MKEARSYVMTTRAAKAEATKARIRAAASRLYAERPIEDFTLDDVARSAETTVQTVLRVFGSKDHLILAALDDFASRGVPLRPTPPGDIAAIVSAFFDIYETMGDLVIQRLADEPRRPHLKPGVEAGRKNHREGVRAAMAPQLANASGTARTRLLAMLSILTDVYVWKILRRDMSLSRAASEAIVRDMMEGVTKGEEIDGENPVVELVGRRKSAS